MLESLQVKNRTPPVAWERIPKLRAMGVVSSAWRTDVSGRDDWEDEQNDE